LPFYRKKGEEVAAQLARASWVASSKSNPASKNSLEGPNQNLKIAICTPHFDKFTPLLSKFTEKLQKPIGLDFLLFFYLPSHPY